ncbi:hypothetical protein HED54_14910 [Ochrobactrum anthropi ATCC 49188]|nr:hypothetical protein [Brucella anthropi ATCC 49188]
MIAYAQSRVSAYDQMKEAARAYKLEQKELNREAKEFANLGKDLLGGFIDDAEWRERFRGFGECAPESCQQAYRHRVEQYLQRRRLVWRWRVDFSAALSFPAFCIVAV